MSIHTEGLEDLIRAVVKSLNDQLIELRNHTSDVPNISVTVVNLDLTNMGSGEVETLANTTWGTLKERLDASRGQVVALQGLLKVEGEVREQLESTLSRYAYRVEDLEKKCASFEAMHGTLLQEFNKQYKELVLLRESYHKAIDGYADAIALIRDGGALLDRYDAAITQLTNRENK